MTEEPRTKTKLMTKKHFERVRDKYRSIDSDAERKLAQADPGDKFEFTLVEGSPYGVEEVEKIESQDDMVQALKS